jgi:hypothetical protein
MWGEPPGARGLNGHPRFSPHSIRGHTSPHSLGPIRMGPACAISPHMRANSTHIKMRASLPPFAFIGLKMRSLNLVSEWL